MQKEGYTRDDVYNADETEINWRALPKKSLAARKEATAPGFKTSKERITGMVCANTSGNHILPLLVIGKAKKPRCFKNVVCFPTTYKSQKSAWMNSQVFIDWYTNDFIPQVKRQREQEGRNGKVLLVLDNAPSHPSEDTLNEIDSCFRVMFLPPNVTALIQPMDQGVIEKLKRLYRKQVLRRLLLVENESNDNVVNFSKTINLKDACFMLADALDSLTKQNVMNAWKKLWPIAEELQQQQELGEKEQIEEKKQSQTFDEITKIAARLPGFEQCDENDLHRWLEKDIGDPGFQILTDEEIVGSVLAETNDEVLTDEEECDESEIKGPTHSEAFDAFETAMAWCEQQNECCSTQLLFLKKMKDLAATKRVTNLKQKKNE